MCVPLFEKCLLQINETSNFKFYHLKGKTYAACAKLTQYGCKYKTGKQPLLYKLIIQNQQVHYHHQKRAPSDKQPFQHLCNKLPAPNLVQPPFNKYPTPLSPFPLATDLGSWARAAAQQPGPRGRWRDACRTPLPARRVRGVCDSLNNILTQSHLFSQTSLCKQFYLL